MIAERFQWSLVLGPAVIAVLLLPLLVMHHRRFGGVEGHRLAWSVAACGYGAALVAFTVLPLPDFGGGWCEAQAGKKMVSLDPTTLFREIGHAVGTRGPAGLMTSWPVREGLMNVALFLPLGLFARRLMEWPRRAVLGAALATSLAIELTQLSANWGLSPCQYRFADVTDLMTNVLGAAVGLLIADLLPKPRRTLVQLESRRDVVRPVTASRRLTGMAVDACCLALGAAAGATATIPWDGVEGLHDITRGEAVRAIAGLPVPMAGAWVACMLLVLVPAAAGNGASVGQRTVHLRPVPPRGGAVGRAALLLRALAGMGVITTLIAAGTPWAFLGAAWALVCGISATMRVEGVTGVVSGCRMRDARAG